MTEIQDETVRKQAMDLGCVAFLEKPFASDQLLEKLAKAVTSNPTFERYRADPLFKLLRRYQIERKAFDDAADGILDRDWDRTAQETWSGTQDEIIRLEPPATTTAGALLALDHVLLSDDLFAERSESAELQMLWYLIRAARDYIATAK